ncbi:thiamine pyrophosphate-binding protein [Microcoleus sp.]|uniref:thiamine pyrophosphate-binding protein n=1 Tax=Microcoleus sp. TaxID=44472 RepID=UPI0035240DDE
MKQNRSSYYSTRETVTVAQLLLQYLELEGTNKLFGYPGAANKSVLEELKCQKDKFDYLICRQETGAVYIADGYSRVTGQLGVVLVTSGPGATNALTGTANAQQSNSPLLIITGEPSEANFGKGYLQEGVNSSLRINAIYRNACQYSAMISNENNFQTLFTQALRTALSIPSRAAHLSLPDNVASSSLKNITFPNTPENYRTTPSTSDPKKVKQAFDYLIDAVHPLIFLGNGCRQVLQGERLRKFIHFVEKFAIPVMTTPDGKGVFPENHELSLRNYGLAACEWPKYYIAPEDFEDHKYYMGSKYDALMVMGSNLDGLATRVGKAAWDNLLIPNGPFIQVDLDQSIIGRGFPIELGIVAEIGAVIDNLFELSESTPPNKFVEERRKFIQHIKTDHSPFITPHKMDSDANPILPQALMKCIQELRPPGTHLFIDGGNCIGWSLHYLVIDQASQMHNSLNLGPTGFGTAAVVGGKVGAPDKTCIAITGDGGFMMQGNEIATAAKYNIGAIWIVLQDNDLGMVSQTMMYTSGSPLPNPEWKNYYNLGNPDLAKFAEGLGADAYNIYSPKEMRERLAQAMKNAALNNKPQVIVAHINTDEVPPYYGQDVQKAFPVI